MTSFSIIIATYNAGETLQRALDSVANQKNQDKQLIIIDGGSDDNTLDIIKHNQECIDFWISEPDNGIYSAWNKALPYVDGQWVYFLGADDYLANPDVLSVMAKRLAEIPENILVAYGKVNILSVRSEYLYTCGTTWADIEKKFKQLMALPHQGVFHRKKLFDDYGSFDESLHIAGDYELLLRYLKNNSAIFAPVEIAMMPQGGVSSDPKNSLIMLWEARRAQKKNGLRIPGMFWFAALCRVYLRAFVWVILGEQKARKLLDFGRGVLGRSAHWSKN